MGTGTSVISECFNIGIVTSVGDGYGGRNC